jgi:quercetin dioxygenase-like cupin family protein
MTIEVSPFPRPDWSPLPREGCVNVEGRVLLELDRLTIAMLRFETGATIDEHAAPHDIDVLCLEGAGMTSVGAERVPLRPGQRVRWPAGEPHRLWTEDSTMLTLMVEHLRRAARP